MRIFIRSSRVHVSANKISANLTFTHTYRDIRNSNTKALRITILVSITVDVMIFHERHFSPFRDSFYVILKIIGYFPLLARIFPRNSYFFLYIYRLLRPLVSLIVFIEIALRHLF